MKHSNSQYQTLVKLSCVVETRLAVAQRKLESELAATRKIQAEIVERQARVDSLTRDIQALQQWLDSSPVSSTGLSAPDYSRGLVRRHWLDYDFQREQYYLDMTYDELTEQQVLLRAAQSKVRALSTKQDILNKQIRSSASGLVRHMDRQLDSEFQAAWCSREVEL